MSDMFLAKYKIVLAVGVVAVMAVAILAVTGGPVSSQEDTPSSWSVRCDAQREGDQKGHCEVFQRLIVQETGQRVVEFAIGFPQDKDNARGVMILPLGISLPEGAQMKIDDGQVFKFNMRYCTVDGCVAFLNMNKVLLDKLRNGKEATITFKTINGQGMDVRMSLSGFTKSLEEASKS